MKATNAAEMLARQAQMARALADDPQPLDAGPTQLIETHFSWVILTQAFAFKLKKALPVDWLCHDTAAARRLACLSEWHLNRRLAPNVYIGVIPVNLRHGRVVIAARTKPAEDHLLCMHRLCHAHSLEWLIKHDLARSTHLQSLGRRLTDFYRNCPPEWLSPARHHQALMNRIKHHAQELQPHQAALSSDPQALCAALMHLGKQLQRLIEERVRLGWIREIHGDLRPEHVYFTPQPVVIDCLEFSRDLRLLDPVDEIAFLAMECDRAKAPHLGEALRGCYEQAMPDAPPSALWHFYKASRAILWAVLGLRHQHHPHQWQSHARDYLDLARQYLNQLQH